MRQLKLISSFALVSITTTARLSAQTRGAPGSGQFGSLGWNWDPLILTSLVIAGLGFLVGLFRMGGDVRSRVIGNARCAAFAAGITALFVALISPLDALDDQLFAAHMVQHLILLMIAPPLLIAGRPGLVCLWALPLSTRRWISRMWIATRAREAAKLLMSPAVVWILGGTVLAFWHLPGPFGWAVAGETVHAFEHICFFVTSLMFWSLVLEPSGHRQMDYGMTLLFVATFGLQNGLLGALLTFAGHPLYDAYLDTTASWGLTPLEDQQLGGLLMWIPASLIHLATLGVLFVSWMGASERQAARNVAARPHVPARTAVLSCLSIVIFSAMGLSGCSRRETESTWKVAGAQAFRGPALIQAYGCGACHMVPGVAGATGQVGPPLGDFGRRTYIAGMLHNDPYNLVLWLRQPQSVVPGNAMPDMHVTEQDARDIAAFLYDGCTP